MDKTFELVICIDKLGTKKIVLEKNTIDNIDKLTTSFENSDEIRCYFSDKVEQFEEKYKSYMESLSEKNNRKEQGDITIIGTINKEKRRIKVLYNKHIEVFDEYIIRNEQFQNYLRKSFYEEYCKIQQIKSGKIKFNEEISFLIRKIIKVYNQYAKDNNRLPIDTIYKHMLKEIELIREYQSLYNETYEEIIEPEQLEAYELEFMKEKQKYDIEDIKGTKEIKGRQKTKKIIGGN